MIREDGDGANDPATHHNETYAGGADVGVWTSLTMTGRSFPAGEPWDMPEIDLTELPIHIADQYWVRLTGYSDVLLDYYIEAEDSLGYVKRSPIQHVWVGTGGGGAEPDNSVRWKPEFPEAGDSVTIYYDPSGGPLSAAPAVSVHLGTNGWQGVFDDPMIWSAADTAWCYGYSIPSTATSIDLVFHDNNGIWDNNNGADWVIPVLGGTGPPFFMDGQLDDSANFLATDGTLSLWGAIDGSTLYLATEGTGTTNGDDRFLFILADTLTTRGAPWTKSGSVLSWDYLLAAEESNGWSGWFDAAETVISNPSVDGAHGGVLEGTLDLTGLYGDPLPAGLYLAASGYGTAGGGLLGPQAPGGNGDGDIALPEYHYFSLTSTGIPGNGLPVHPTLALRLMPNPFNPSVRLTVEFSGRQGEITIYDVGGREINRLPLSPGAAGLKEVIWDGMDSRGEPVRSGIYFFRARSGIREVVRKGVLLR